MRWDELTPGDFLALRKACGGFCVLPVAAIETHGGHLPLGIDSFVGEEICRRASELEPMMVFPVLRYAVNGEATANPGAIALRTETLVALLDNLCDEIARNGFHKILLYSSHGGNGQGLPFYVQQWAVKPRDYMIYFQSFGYSQVAAPKNLKTDIPNPSAHGGLYESSSMIAIRPETVKMDRLLPVEYSANLARLKKLREFGIYTAVNYYANFPHHWAGPAHGASREIGNEILDERAKNLAQTARAIKEDTVAPQLMKEFLRRAAQGGTLEAGTVPQP